MSIETTVIDGMKDAMRAKDKVRLEAFRGIKAAFMLERTHKGKDSQLTEEEELKILMKLKKQRQESAELYQQQNREDLAKEELEQLEVIENLLPKMLTEEEMKAGVKAIIEETGAEGMKDMGKVMGMASKKMAGRADGKMLSNIVRQMLA